MKLRVRVTKFGVIQGQRSRRSRSNKGSKERQVGSQQRQIASFYFYELYTPVLVTENYLKIK